MPLLLLFWRVVRYPDHKPIAQELAQSSAQNNRDENVAIEVHNQQHDNVGQTERDAVNYRTNELLQCGGTEGRVLKSKSGRGAVAAVGGHGGR